MQGIELSEKYYNQFGKQMIERDFSEYQNRIAVGICGEGSECFVYDDEISVDHDFDMGFCLFITKEDYKEIGFKLERAYANLPKEFLGYKRQNIMPVGGNRKGVMVIEDFYKHFLGVEDVPQDENWWFYVPETSLACVSNGKIFRDDLGKFSQVRKKLIKGYPQDVRLKKIAAHLILAGQSGQYNYNRCLSHGEIGAAALAVDEFVRHCISLIYLLNNKYQPFYKWAFKGLRDLPILSDCETALEGLLDFGNRGQEGKMKIEIIEDVSSIIINQLKEQKLTMATCNNLETHAFSVTDKISNANIRNMHIMEGI